MKTSLLLRWGVVSTIALSLTSCSAIADGIGYYFIYLLAMVAGCAFLLAGYFVLSGLMQKLFGKDMPFVNMAIMLLLAILIFS